MAWSTLLHADALYALHCPSHAHAFCALCHSPGVVGCALSHLGVWQDISELHHPLAAALVLEDDVKLAPGFEQGWQWATHALAKDDSWDLAFLGFHHQPSDQLSYHLLYNDPPVTAASNCTSTPTRVLRWLRQFDPGRSQGAGAFAYVVL